ncbi:hypothetical protein VNI00_014319 [Paramarasmius palmivorus]|uniref:AB hydrolase-1 domain-containing protein n=1 Tax=Paramarasmius palmivorus TaxID=297713 RepID=A0AAW0BS48_9AGAR
MVSSDILHPLTAKKVEYTYCLDRPLKCIATRYTSPGSSSEDGYTLVLASGISLTQDTWIPVIKELFKPSSSCQSSRVKLQSVWVIERPNHGDAGLVNAEILKEHYSVKFLSLQYAKAIATFVQSDILSPSERKNLIGVGHSGAGGSMIIAIQYCLKDRHKNPFKELILLDTPMVGRDAWPFFEVLYRAVKKSNARRVTTWSSREEAMKWFKSRPPWKSFHPDVMKIVEDTYFVPDMEKPGNITTKTTLEQEQAAFFDDGSQLDSHAFLPTILEDMPTHLVFATIQDIWYLLLLAAWHDDHERQECQGKRQVCIGDND